MNALLWPALDGVKRSRRRTSRRCLVAIALLHLIGLGLGLPELGAPVAAQEQTPTASVSPGASDSGSATVAGAGSTAGGGPVDVSASCSNSDAAGAPGCGQEAGNPINISNGNKFQREVDMPALPGVLGLELVRFYNSSQSRPGDAPGLFGRGWRLSYDWHLRLNPSQRSEGVVLVKGDGTEIGLVKHRRDGNWDGIWVCMGRPEGQLEERRQHGRTVYVWTSLKGLRHRFDERGRLMAIEAATGEVLNIEREEKGDITRVQDPQGRELRFELLSDTRALREQRFGGAQAVASPLGRYVYRYGGEAPAGSKVERWRLLNRLLSVEHAGVLRSYLYEDVEKPGLLTGIQVSGKGTDGVMMNVRIATWAYDKAGRAVLSVRGQKGSGPAAAGPAGSETIPPPERVSLQFLPITKNHRGQYISTTLLSNGLGQKTVYRFVKIMGRAELLEVVGAGCASCGESNVRNVYDARGLLTEVVKLSPLAVPGTADARTAPRVKAGDPLESLLLSHDAMGRPVRRERRVYIAGRAQAALTEMRVEYAKGPFPLNWLPVLIARPSVLAGKEHVTRISHNPYGQTLSIEESGYSPLESMPILRSMSYRYEDLGGRSVLREVDGPLPNGPKGGPEDSDVTRFNWDAMGSRVTQVTVPGGFTQHYQYDGAGRISRLESMDGFRKIATELRYHPDGRHAMSIDRQFMSGEILAASRNEALRLASIRPFEAWFDALGRLTRHEDAAGREVRREYDASNRLISIADAAGNRSRSELDAEGHRLRIGLYRAGQNSLLRASHFWHDDFGRMTARLLPDGRLDTWRFDVRGRMVEHVDGDDVRSTFMTSKDRPVQASIRQAPDGDIEWRLSNAAGRLRGVDDFGRRVEVILPDHGNKQASHDEAGRIVQVRRADGSRIDFQYDLAGRLVSTRYLDSLGKPGSGAVNRYEGLTLVAREDNELSTRYLVDALGRRLEQVVTIKALGKDYRFGQTLDPSTGLARSHTLADGRVLDVERLDARAGRTVSALRLRPSWVQSLRTRLSEFLPASWAAWTGARMPAEDVVTRIEVDPLNGLSAFTMGNGLKTQRQFDLAGRLTRQTTDRLGTLHYGHQTGPRIREIRYEPETDTSPAKPHTVRYEYSGFGQLKTSGAADLLRASIQAPDSAPITRAGTPSSRPRDALGRMTEDERFLFSYTLAGQLSEVHSKADKRLIARYRYDSQSRRVSKTVFPEDSKLAPSVTYFLWQDQSLVGEIDARGHLTTQYLYLKEGAPGHAGPGMPIAKLESKDNADNPTGHERTLFIHPDHRGAPVALSDGEVNSYACCGHASSGLPGQGLTHASSSHKGARALNLGLPGQYFDDETGLSDNLHRTYDELRGLYLQPDPLGYPDSADPYLYASGDPVNKIDSLGLYEEDVHYYLTNFLALVAGLSEKQARVLALADRYIDDNPNTQPFYSLDARKFYHFTQIGFDPLPIASEVNFTPASYVADPDLGEVLVPARTTYSASYKQRRIMSPSNPQIERLQDYAMGAPNPCAKTQLYGEFLHAFQDTFAHRDPDNVPYGPVGGHVLAAGFPGHDPDKTYDHVDSTNVNWFENARRTKEMEMEVFKMLQADFGTTAKTSWLQIEKVLDQFNADRSPESSAIEKAEILNNFLKSIGAPTIAKYDVENARQCRHANIGQLDPQKYPGTILGTPYMNVKEFKKTFQCA